MKATERDSAVKQSRGQKFVSGPCSGCGHKATIGRYRLESMPGAGTAGIIGEVPRLNYSEVLGVGSCVAPYAALPVSGLQLVGSARGSGLAFRPLKSRPREMVLL